MIELDSKTKLDLYSRMLRVRLIEEEIAIRYPEGKMRCPTHLSIGQEAVSAGVCTALKDTDFAVSSHRAHGHYIAKGGNLKTMIAEIYGKASGCSFGKGGSMHLIDESVGFMGSTAIVGGTIPVGVGLAFSSKYNLESKVTSIFFGDGAIEEGVFYESLNFAILHELPVLFVCENNFYSVYSSLKQRQPKGREIFEMVKGVGIASTQSDGNDVESVFSQTQHALDTIRKNGKPYFLEFLTYRWREHCGPNFDNDIGYRTPEEYQNWRSRDPIETYESKLNNEGIDSARLKLIHKKIKDEVLEAFSFAEASDFPEAQFAYQGEYKE